MARTSLPDGAAPLELLREIGESSEARLLTIVIGSYNHQRYLAEAFAAIEASGVCHRLALIFIDDGSPDETIPFVRQYPFNPALQVSVFSKRNAGLRDTLASALALTDTPFVAFIASDDFYEPSGLAAIVARLDARQADDVCWICQARYLEGRDGEVVYSSAFAETLAADPERRERALSIEFPKPLLLQSTVFGTQLLRDARAWTDGLTLDDWPTFIKIARLSRYRAIDMRAILDVALCRYRIHNSGTHNNLERQLHICMEVAERGVAPEYRREATANIFADVALIHLYQGNLGNAARLFGRALATFPRPATVIRPTWRIASSALRRMTRNGAR
jgi:glycosyltransferase involved in cell wall biosynthesis